VVYNHPSDKHAKQDAKHEPAVYDAPLMRVKCIIHERPWTGTKALVHGEEADIPEELAERMIDLKQVERVK
jgi:hypothetical protein